MLIQRSSNVKRGNVDDRIAAVVEHVEADWLRNVVERISIPRHFIEQPENNRRIAAWIEGKFRDWGYQTTRQGEFDNIVAMPDESVSPRILIGAHYDSRPETPGADDNASAVAAMMGCAEAIATHGGFLRADICFVAFNREEDSLLGSIDFVSNYLPDSWNLAEVHILEMVGYCDSTPGSQRLPPGLPIKLAHDRGDFLGLIANRHSNKLVPSLLKCASTYVPDFPVWGLKVMFGLENRFKDLRRSDHAPFWDKKIPAFMWTDTSEFRNANYHKPTDTPDTLDYEFLQNVTRFLVARVLSS